MRGSKWWENIFWWTVPCGADFIRYKNFFLTSSQHPPSFTQEHIRNHAPLLFIFPSSRIKGAGCGNICSIWLQQIQQLFSWKEPATLKGGLSSSEAPGLSPALSLRSAVCMPLTIACKSPFIHWQPDGVAGIIGRAWWAPFNLSSRVKELVSRSIWAGCNSSQGSRGYVKT